MTELNTRQAWPFYRAPIARRAKPAGLMLYWAQAGRFSVADGGGRCRRATGERKIVIARGPTPSPSNGHRHRRV